MTASDQNPYEAPTEQVVTNKAPIPKPLAEFARLFLQLGCVVGVIGCFLLIATMVVGAWLVWVGLVD